MPARNVKPILGARRQGATGRVGSTLVEGFVFGRRRTQEQDPEYGVHQLPEVDVRALSPGVNDPLTAISCIDWRGAILCRVGSRSMRSPRRADSDGRLRVIVDSLTFEGMLAAAFNQIRQYSEALLVAIRLLEALETLARIVPHLEDPLRREAVGVQAEMVFGAADVSDFQTHARRDLEQRYREVWGSLWTGA